MNKRVDQSIFSTFQSLSVITHMALLSAGCMMTTETAGTRVEGVATAQTGDANAGDPDAGADCQNCSQEPSERTRATVCRRWLTDTASTHGLAGFAPATDRCAPGVLPAATREGALRLTNTFRWLAGLGPVALDARDNDAAQACAVLTEANGQMSHTPPRTWSCWSQLGYDGTSRSNIIGLPGAYRINAYAAVGGWLDEARDLSGSLGHRRWILSPELSVIGYGQSLGYACMYVLDDRMAVRRRDRVSWPSEGYFPMEAMTRTWSVSSSALGLSARTAVQVWINGRATTVQPTVRPIGPGDDTVSWEMPAVAADSEVRVRVTGVIEEQNYVVRPVNCR